MKTKFILIISLACGVFAICSQSAIAQGTTGKWVWSDTGWGTKITITPPAAGGPATASVTPPTGQVDATATAWPAFPSDSRTASAEFSTTRTFYWTSNCGAPSPTPFTRKTGTVSANYTGSTAVSSTPSGSGNSSGIIYVGAFLSYSDDYNGSGDSFHGQAGSLAAPARYASDNKIPPAAPTTSGSSSATLSVNSKLKNYVTFYAHYEITGSTTATHTSGLITLQKGIANGDLAGSLPY